MPVFVVVVVVVGVASAVGMTVRVRDRGVVVVMEVERRREAGREQAHERQSGEDPSRECRPGEREPAPTAAGAASTRRGGSRRTAWSRHGISGCGALISPRGAQGPPGSAGHGPGFYPDQFARATTPEAIRRRDAPRARPHGPGDASPPAG